MNKKVTILIRHAESVKNTLNIFSDIKQKQPLTEKGYNQAQKIAHFLKTISSFSFPNGIHIYSDTDIRTFHTAEIISDALKVKHSVADFESINVGLLKGVSEETVKKTYPELAEKEDLYRLGKIDGYEIEYPEGDTIQSFQRKKVNTYKEIWKDSNSSALIIVTHQSVIGAILNHYNKIENKDSLYRFIPVDFCSISTLAHTSAGDGKIGCINYTPT
ncbi:MAG: 2,3-bisphosphoglycerate-dependent phosphoglycerate mutase [Bacteroidia bacterium]|nr:2,3-bisphosphoglycerate-dependent phosphoglycerate mutase [Bacteroidia bacterium]